MFALKPAPLKTARPLIGQAAMSCSSAGILVDVLPPKGKVQPGLARQGMRGTS